MRLLIGVVFSVLLCMLPLPLFSADTILQKQMPVVSSADTMIHDTPLLPPGGGSTPTVAVGTTRDNRHARMLIKFDVPMLPPDATLTNAFIAFDVAQAPAGGAAAPFSFHQMLRPWDEMAATWDDSGLDPWGDPGAVPGFDFVAAPAATNILGDSGHYEFRDPSLLNLAFLWMTNPAANMGLILLCDSAVLQTAKRVYTREESTETQRPLLVLEYFAPFRILFTRVERVGDTIEFDFTAEPGRSYSVEYKESLNDSAWIEFATFPDPGAETTYTFADFPDGSGRIYRVVSP